GVPDEAAAKEACAMAISEGYAITWGGQPAAVDGQGYLVLRGTAADPRGTGGSSAFTCWTAGEADWVSYVEVSSE
ncbi:MAG: hypothetical protein LBG60_16025, partial [Bifidobacteriaceae bacterium]|nr:hypothetical protein [Bifidobacteriaceae bacterium]